MNKKRILTLVLFVTLALTLSGCGVARDESGNIATITSSMTFSEVRQNEGFFAAFLVYPLAQLINYLGPKTNPLIAIFVVSFGIHALVTALTWKANVSQQKTMLLQPELQKIQKKYEGKDDQNSRMRMSMEMQELYKKNNVSIGGSFIVLFIQFPILIAVYHAVIRSEYIQTAKFMGIDFSQTPSAGLAEGKWIYIVVIIVMLALQFLSMQLPMMLQERRKRALAEKQHRKYEKAQNPMGSTMYVMMFVIAFMMLSWPSAMSFYYCVSSLVMILKNLIIDRLLNKEMEG